MATEGSDIGDRVVKEVLSGVEKYMPTEFDLLTQNPEKKSELVEAVRAIVEEEVKLAKEFRDFKPCEDAGEVKRRLEKCLPHDRVVDIEEGFKPHTYHIHIVKKIDGAHYADFIRHGAPIYLQKKLDNHTSLDTTSYLQIASIVVEAVLLVLQVVGIKLSISGRTITKTAEEILPVIKNSSAIQKAIQALKTAAKSGTKTDIAKAIFNLIKDSYGASILWKITKSLCSNMSWWDWTKTAGIVTAQIIAAFATGGAVLIAKIVLALNSGYEFIKKLTNLDELDEIKKGLPKPEAEIEQP